MTVCFFLPVPFFLGRTTFIGSGAADVLDEGWPDSWYDENEDVDGSPMELLGARLFVGCGCCATEPSGISPSRSTTKASE